MPVEGPKWHCNHDAKMPVEGRNGRDCGLFSEVEVLWPFRGRTGIYRSVSGNSAPRQRRGGNAGSAIAGTATPARKKEAPGSLLADAVKIRTMLRNRSAAALVETQPARRATSWHRANRGRAGNTLGQAPLAPKDRPYSPPAREPAGVPAPRPLPTPAWPRS